MLEQLEVFALNSDLGLEVSGDGFAFRAMKRIQTCDGRPFSSLDICFDNILYELATGRFAKKKWLRSRRI